MKKAAREKKEYKKNYTPAERNPRNLSTGINKTSLFSLLLHWYFDEGGSRSKKNGRNISILFVLREMLVTEESRLSFLPR